MCTIQTADGTEIYYKDWGTGPVITFSHGWPLNADAWDPQLHYFVRQGYRVIAHDRRGHGRSSQPSSGNDMDHYADDLATLINALDLQNITMIGHSTGGGEVVRYLARHGTSRVARAVLIGAVPPILLKSPSNPNGVPAEVFDGLRTGLAADPSQFWQDFALPFYGANRPGAKVSKGILDQFWLWSMQAGLHNAIECITAFSATDFTEDLRKIDVPVLLVHGEEDQIVPIANHAKKAAKILPHAQEAYYKGAPHGLMSTHQAQLHADLLRFITHPFTVARSA